MEAGSDSANSRKRTSVQDPSDNKRRTFNNLTGGGIMSSDILFTSDDSGFNVTRPFNKIYSNPSNNISSESVYHFHPTQSTHVVSSSPPNAGFLNSSPQMDPYPKDGDQFFTSQATMIPTNVVDSDDSEATINFNVTRLNKVHGYISSDYTRDDHDTNDEELNNIVNRIIGGCIENGNPKVHLENLELKTISDDIGDLEKLVCLGKNGVEVPNIEIYATHNRLKILPPRLLDIRNIKVLSLRDNKLKKIPGKIQNLTRLTDFSIANNEMKVVPYQILKLPNLVNFLARPNSGLIELSDQDESTYYCINDEKRSEDVDIRRYVSKLKFTDSSILSSSSQFQLTLKSDRELAETVSAVPKLSELSLRAFSKYSASYFDTMHWQRNVPRHIQLQMTKSIQKRIYGETCSVCDHITVNPIAKSLEWWDFKSQKLIPVRRNFCSGNCIRVWLADVEECRKLYNGAIPQINNEPAHRASGTATDGGSLQFDIDF
jgi:hypothetical protein